jgi:hypothetical protein
MAAAYWVMIELVYRFWVCLKSRMCFNVSVPLHQAFVDELNVYI